MSKHDHPAPKPPCIHEGTLRFCATCNAVECTACGFEWKAPMTDATTKMWAKIAEPCTRPHRDEPLRPWFSGQWAPHTRTSEPMPLFPGQTFCQTEGGGVSAGTAAKYTQTFVEARESDPVSLQRWLERVPAGLAPDVFPRTFPKHNH